jgi:hypothetical protein
MKRHLSALWGTLHYEFRMQIRRPAVWIILFLIGLFFFDILFLRPSSYFTYLVTNTSLTTTVAAWAIMINRFMAIGVGVLLADRLVRDRRTRVDEILTTMPEALSLRLTGKYLGTLLATLVPVFIIYNVGIVYIVYLTGNLMAILIGLAAFALVIMPGMLFVAAFSLACPLIMWLPLYQFCFIGYWFWGNMLSPNQGIPTLSGTILTPIGGYMAKAFFGVDEGVITTASPLQATASIALLIGIAVLAMCILWALLRWQQARQ